MFTAVVAAVIEWRQIRRSARRAREKALDTVLAPAFRSLPVIADVEPHRLGVFRSTTAQPFIRRGETLPPYVPRYVDRDLDMQLQSSLSSGMIVVVVGPSKAGKSRAAYEAIARLFPDRRIIVPASPGDPDRNPCPVGDLAEIDPPMDFHPSPPVLWLDDIENYARDLFRGNVGRLRSRYPGMVTIATVQLTRSDLLYDHRNIEPFVEIHLAADLDGTEQEKAAVIYPDLVKDPSFRRLGEYFVAAAKLRAKYRKGPEEHPAGRAIVDAAIDWRRAGMIRPIPEAELRDLAGLYLAREDIGLDLTDEAFAAALDWARKTVVSSAALLVLENTSGGRTYRAFDYIVDLVAGSDAPVPTWTWTFVFTHASDDDHVAVGLAARTAGRRDEAARVWSAIAGGDGPAAAWASLYLGRLRGELRDADAARSAFEQALESAEPRAAAEAALELGHLLKAEGEIAGARKAWRQALDSGDAQVVPSAAFHFGLLLSESGDMAGAEDWWQRAAGHTEHSSAQKARLRLAELYVAQGRANEALETLQLVLGRDRTGEAFALRAEALLRLGRYTEAHHDAERALEQARWFLEAHRAESSATGAELRIVGMACEAATLALLKLSRPSDARVFAAQAVDATPRSARAWAMLSRCAVAVGDFATAAEAASKSSRIDPCSAVGERALAEVAMAANDPSARSHAEAAVLREPDDAASRVLLGRVHLRGGQDREALVAFSEALAFDPDQANFYDEEPPFDWVVRIWIQGRRRRAREHTRAFVSLLPLGFILVPCLAVVFIAFVVDAVRTRTREEAPSAYPSRRQRLGHHTRAMTDAVRDSWEAIAGPPEQRYAEYFETVWATDGSAPDMPPTAVSLLEDVGLMRRATSVWRPAAAGLLTATGGLGIWEGVYGQSKELHFDPASLGIALMCLAIAAAVLHDWVKARTKWHDFPQALRTRLTEADYSARTASFFGPFVPFALLGLFSLFLLVDSLRSDAYGDRLFWHVLATILGATAVAGFAKSWRAWSASTDVRARTSDEVVLRHARSDLVPTAALTIMVSGLSWAVNTIATGDPLWAAAAGIVVAFGMWLFARWSKARRVVLALAGGHRMLQRRSGADQLSTAGRLSAAPRPSWPIALGALLGVSGSLAIYGFIEDGRGPSQHEPGPLVLGVGLVGVAAWLFVRGSVAAVYPRRVAAPLRSPGHPDR